MIMQFRSGCLLTQAWFSYLEVRDGNNENSTRIGTRLCGENPPPFPIYASGSEIHIKFFSAPLCEPPPTKIPINYLCYGSRPPYGPHGPEAVLTKLKSFRGFKMKIEAEIGSIMEILHYL